jgi:hypothetical protein
MVDPMPVGRSVVLNVAPEEDISKAIWIGDKQRELGVHPHFLDREIEIKLEILGSQEPIEQIMIKLMSGLKALGYLFPHPEIYVRENYCVYYSKKDGRKGKIIARGLGSQGFLYKQKSENRSYSEPGVIIKDEEKSPVFKTFAEAKDHLASKAGIKEGARLRVESIIKIRKLKQTILAIGDDSITRFFSLTVDESSIPLQEPSNRVHRNLRQIEVEYKGSDKQEKDSLEVILAQILKIRKQILLQADVPTRKTLQSKRQWALEKYCSPINC